MMTVHTRQSVLAEAIEQSRSLVLRFIAGFDDSNHTRQAAHLPNHFAWCMGHLAFTMHRVGLALDGGPIPEADFIEKAPRGDAQRFATETIGFRSTPVDDKAIYPTHARCIEIFSSAIDRLAHAAGSADDATLDRTIPWGVGESQLAALVPRMVYHNGVHVGQLIDLRRALGMKNVLG
jgi:hypothetical protein